MIDTHPSLNSKTYAVPNFLLVSCLILAGCGGSTNNSSSQASESSQSSSQASSLSSSSQDQSSSSSVSSSSSSTSPITGDLVIAVNAGGNAGSFSGIEFLADRYARGGQVSSTTDPISGTTAQGLYQSERYGDYTYSIPVTEGSYSIVLHFAEIFQTEAGARAFNLDIEGSNLLSQIDLFSLAGHDGAISFEFSDILVSDGSLDIDLESVSDNATLSGFEIYSVNGELDTSGPESGAPNSMGFIGCSMAENTATGYRAVGGMRMWGPYGTGGDVVQNWTNNNSASWNKFDSQVAMYGEPTAVWVQICIFSQAGVTYDEVKTLVSNARSHAAPGAHIYISGQPVYANGHNCFLAGDGGAELTDNMAQMAGNDASLDVEYVGQFGPLVNETEVSDGCHANTAGERKLGQQAVEYFGG